MASLRRVAWAASFWCLAAGAAAAVGPGAPADEQGSAATCELAENEVERLRCQLQEERAKNARCSLLEERGDLEQQHREDGGKGEAAEARGLLGRTGGVPSRADVSRRQRRERLRGSRRAGHVQGAHGVGRDPPAPPRAGRRALASGRARRADEAQTRAPLCMDSPAGWRDSLGHSCHVYVQSGFCTPSGDHGPNWNWYTFEDYQRENHTAATACCGCGGGRGCEDAPGWLDKNGNDCAVYAAKNWCAEGGPGPGWPAQWGSLADQGAGGQTAATACCACKPSPRDAGGRTCDYYAAHPLHCGCCDDEDFIAQIACAEVCSEHAQPAEPTDLEQRLAGWPNATRQVIFNGRGLTGRLAAEDWPARFPRLQVVDLSHNDFLEGSTVPRELGSLPELQCLRLEGNQLQGTIPAQLGQMRALEVLRLSFNLLEGTLPDEVGQLTALRQLHSSYNQLTGTLPAALAKLGKLSVLNFDTNRLTGTMPSELGNLTQLIYLYLRMNLFTGTLPGEWGKLSNLVELVIELNQLTGPVFPREFGALGRLQLLSAYSCNFTGPVPRELGQAAGLQEVWIDHNQLSGTLPAELGNLSALTQLEVPDNLLTGTLPPELGRLAQLTLLKVGNNMFTGAVPKEMGSLQQLQGLYLAGNDFTSLPPELGHMQALMIIDVRDNPHLGGAFPDTTGSPNLIQVFADGCRFTTAGAVGSSVATLSFARNQFTSLPMQWEDLPSVTVLDLNDNQISVWRPYGVLEVGVFLPDLNYTDFNCGNVPLESRLNWPAIEKVDLSGNPLGASTTTRDFIWSFGYLHRLSDLRAASCGLRGEVPFEGYFFAKDMPHTGDSNCNNVPIASDGFPALYTLDLSRNHITAMYAPPPQRLSLALLHSNALTGKALNSQWFSILGNLEVWNNTELRADVAPPRGDKGCPPQGASYLLANSFAWTEGNAEDPYQCTSLCAGQSTRYKHDQWFNTSSLCRCKAGRAGSAMNCTGCPADTYSESLDTWGMVRTCRPCPELSITNGIENATAATQCKCPAGWYMGTAPQADLDNNTTIGDSLEAACVRCGQGEFQTTLPGATQADQCLCNTSYNGLRQLLGKCGCVDGQYMDHAARECVPCDATAEDCTWGVDVQLSLMPPVVRAAYWTEPRAELGPNSLANFAKNEIWRCVSEATCQRGGVCAKGRQGHTCSLCQPGMFGGPDGECSPCPRSPAETQRGLLWGLLIGPAATVVAHLVLQRTPQTRAVGAALTLQSLSTSVKQVLKYIQMLGVLAAFSVHWPPLPRKFMADVSRVTVALPQLAGAACLTGQQTASVEMGFRWLLPVAGLLSACLAALLLYPACWWCRDRRWSGALRMDHWDILRVSLWGSLLYYSTLLQFGTQVLTCTPSPNGKATVLSFPHLVCPDSQEWQALAGVSSAFLATFVVAVYVAIYCAWRRASRALVHSQFKSAGWWGFLFTDFRASCTHWAMLTMSKDVVLVVIAMAGAAEGSSQLLTTAAAASCYAYLVLRDQPFNDPSNSVLEAWTTMSVASLCVFSAAMGYQSTPSARDVSYLYKEGEESDTYKQRARAMLIVQWLTFLGPAVIVMYQLLTISARVKKKLPLFLRPMDDEERKAWSDSFFKDIGLPESSYCNLRVVVERMDSVELENLRQLMGTTTATLGIMRSSSSLQAVGRRRMSRIATELEGFAPVPSHEKEKVVDRVVIVTV